MTLSTVNSDLRINGGLSADSFNLSAGCVDNTNVATAAGIDASKVTHRIYAKYAQDLGAAVAAKTALIHIAKFAGTVVGVHVVTTTHPTSSDTVTVDIKKSTALGSFNSILTGVVTLNSSSVDKTVYDGSLSSTAYVADDVFEVVVAVSGSSCQGLCVVLVCEEQGV